MVPGTRGGNRPRRGGASVRQAQRDFVLELLCLVDLESTRRERSVPTDTLIEWRGALFAGGAGGLTVRQEDLVEEQSRRQERVIAELTMENELLRERIRRMEDEKPFLRWRSNK